MAETTTILVDDHPAFRQGLRALLEQEKTLVVAGEADDGLKAIQLVRKLSPDLVVMDISMPGLDGIAATRKILAEFPQVKVVALSVHSGKRFVREMLQAGASGYILKESTSDELVKGIRTVLAGEVYLSKSITDFGHLLSETDSPTEESSHPILRTKLHHPPATADIVPRIRLIEQLEGGRDRAMTLISAPAGYGKSILASQWLAASRLPGAWVSLDESDNDQREFLRYFLTALEGVSAGSALKSKSLLNAAQLPPPKVLARYLLNDLEQTDEPLIMVLDDYHRITDQKIHDLLSELLRYPSPNMHLALLTRRDPPLPLGKLRAHGQLTELAVRDLRFTIEETRAFLERFLHTAVNEETASALENKLEGWVTGVRLAAISMSHGENPQRVLQELGEGLLLVQDYLVREVLSQIPSAQSRYLLEVSLLGRFCAPLCCAVTTAPPQATDGGDPLTGQDFIDWLEETRLFVIPLDDRRKWFRFHHLFQELLQNELKRALTGEEIRTIHRRASQWFEDEGLIDEALKHALAAENDLRTVQLIALHRHPTLNADSWYVLANWLSLIPETIVQQHAELLITRAWVFLHLYRFDIVLPLLDQIESMLTDDPNQESLWGEVALCRGYSFFFLGEGSGSLKQITAALKRIPSHFFEARAQSEVIYALSSQMVGRREQAISSLNDLLAGYDSPEELRKTRLLITYVFIHFLDGDLPRAELADRPLREVSQRGGYSYALNWADHMKGLIHLNRGEWEAAVRHLERCAAQRFIHFRRAAADSIVGLMLAHQAEGREDEAQAALQLLREFTATLDDPALQVLLGSAETRLAIMQQRLEPVRQWLEASMPAPEGAMLWWLDVPLVTRCRALIAAGSPADLAEAEQRLREYATSNENHHNVFQSIGILSLLAVACGKQGKAKEALTALQRALALAQPGNMVFPFLELGQPMAELLDHVEAEGPVRDFVDHLSASLDQRPVVSAVRVQQGSTATAAGDLLTQRELEILPYLSEGLSNKEISGRIQVTPETIKKHLKNIYRKLRVGSRARAVVKARSLGILAEDR